MIFSQNLLPKITKSWIFSIPGYPSMIPGYWVPGQYPGIRYPGMGSAVSTSSQSSNLKSHEKTHTGEMPLACSKCDKFFAENGKIKRH